MDFLDFWAVGAIVYSQTCAGVVLECYLRKSSDGKGNGKKSLEQHVYGETRACEKAKRKHERVDRGDHTIQALCPS